MSRARLPPQATAACLGGGVLAAAFRALAVDYRHYSAGLPDLLLLRAWRPPRDAGAAWEVAPAESWLGPLAEHLAEPPAPVDDLRSAAPGESKGAGDTPLGLSEGWRFEARLVEVKGPNDRLSEKQRAWLAVLAAAGADCRLCQVNEPSRLKCADDPE